MQQVSSLSRRNRLKTLSSLDENLFVLFLFLWLWILLPPPPPFLTSLCLKHPSLLCSCSTFSLLTLYFYSAIDFDIDFVWLSKCVKYSKEGRKSFRLLWFLVGFLDLASSPFLSLFSVIPFFLAKQTLKLKLTRSDTGDKGLPCFNKMELNRWILCLQVLQLMR